MAEKRFKPVEWAAGSFAVLFAAAIVGFYLLFDVCDQQVTSAGVVVTACRHVQATDPPVLVSALAILACLGAFFSEVSGFGITLKSRLGAVEQVAGKALRKAEVAVEEASDAKDGQRRAKSTSLEGTRDIGSPMAKLAEQYNELRLSRPRSADRSKAMSALVKEMMAVAQQVENFDVDSHLDSDDAGLRLAGVVYLCQHPAPAKAERLARLAMLEDKAFNAYWALEALKKSGGVLSESTRAMLRQYADDVGPSDRATLTREILATHV